MFWGIWSIWPLFGGIQLLSIPLFLIFSSVTVGLLVFAYWLNGYIGIDHFRPSRSGVRVALIILVVWYAINTLSIVPFSLLTLVVLFGLCWWGLSRNQSREIEEDVIQTMCMTPSRLHLFAVMLISIVGWMVYATFVTLESSIPSNIFVYVIMTPLGFVMFVWALWKLLWKRPSYMGTVNS